MTEPLIVVAGAGGALVGAWLLNPLWKFNEGMAMSVFIGWFVLLVFVAALVGALT